MLAQGIGRDAGSTAVNAENPLTAQALLFQLLRRMGNKVALNSENKDFVCDDAEVDGIAQAFNEAFGDDTAKIWLMERAKYFGNLPQIPPDTTDQDPSREKMSENVARLLYPDVSFSALSQAQRETISGLPFLSLFTNVYTQKSKVLLRIDTRILSNLPSDESLAIYLTLLDKLSDDGMVISLEDYNGGLKDTLKSQLDRLARKSNVSFVSQPGAKSLAGVLALAIEKFAGKITIPKTCIGHFAKETLQGLNMEDLANFTILLIQTKSGVIELNDVNRAILMALGGYDKLDMRTLEVIPELLPDRKFLDTLQEACKNAAHQA